MGKKQLFPGTDSRGFHELFLFCIQSRHVATLGNDYICKFFDIALSTSYNISKSGNINPSVVFLMFFTEEGEN